MAKKSVTTVTGDGTTSVVIRSQDTIFVGGTWSTASVEVRSKYAPDASWYVVEETGKTANFNWSPSAGTGKSIYIDIVVSGGGSPSLDIAHLSD